jgi:hypothetical protein
MSDMPAKKLKRIAWSATTLLLVSTSALAAYKYDTLACSLIDYSGFIQIEKNVYVSPDSSSEDRKELLSLIDQAKTRVITTYGQYSATPVIISGCSMNSLGILASNEYASTKFLPWGSYMVLGPKGHSVDIVAHELVHSEIFELLGYWARTIKLPVWFDEGAAMQVDYRKQYDANGVNDTERSIGKLRYSWDFFQGDDDQLTRNYARAKSEVRHLVSKVGDKGMFMLLKRMKQGESFDNAYKAIYEES